MAIRGTLPWLAQRAVPIGTANAVWTGIGVAGTFIMAVWFNGDPTSLLPYVGVILIIAGVAAMNIARACHGKWP